MAGSTLKDSHEALLIMMTHSQAPTPGGCRQKARCFQLPGRPGGVSGQRGHVCGSSSAGGVPWAARGGCAARLDPRPRHICRVGCSESSSYFSRWEGGWFGRMRGRGERKNIRVWVFSFFSLQLSVVHSSRKRNWLLVGGYGFPSQPLPFGFQSEAI